jgi:hypothetical protein
MHENQWVKEIGAPGPLPIAMAALAGVVCSLLGEDSAAPDLAGAMEGRRP